MANRPKPIALRKNQGNPGKRPYNDAEPKPEVVDDLKPPPGLDRYGRESWNRNAANLQRLGLLTESDIEAFFAYCRVYSRWRRGNIALDKMKLTDDGFRKVAGTIEKAEQQMRLFQCEFGMTPASRSRIRVEPQEKADPFEDWMSDERRSS